MCEVFVNKVKVKKRSFSAKNVPFGSNILRKERKQKREYVSKLNYLCTDFRVRTLEIKNRVEKKRKCKIQSTWCLLSKCKVVSVF